MRGEETGDGGAVGVVPRHPHAERLEAPRQREGRLRVEHPASQGPDLGHPVDERTRTGQRARGEVAVAGQYFDALCMTRSTPSASGCWLTGLAKVLSTIEIAPRARHASATRRMSTHRSVGLTGVSNQTTRVAAVTTRAGSASSSRSTNRVLTPKRASTSRSSRRVPP